MLRSAVEIQMSPGERTVGIKKQKKKSGGVTKGWEFGGSGWDKFGEDGAMFSGKAHMVWNYSAVGLKDRWAQKICRQPQVTTVWWKSWY